MGNFIAKVDRSRAEIVGKATYVSLQAASLFFRRVGEKSFLWSITVRRLFENQTKIKQFYPRFTLANAVNNFANNVSEDKIFKPEVISGITSVEVEKCDFRTGSDVLPANLNKSKLPVSKFDRRFVAWARNAQAATTR